MSKKARCLEIRRSELVTVPSFPPQPNAGSNTSGYRVVIGILDECLTPPQAHISLVHVSPDPALGKLTTGIGRHNPNGFQFFRLSTASKRSTAFKPTCFAIVGTMPKLLYQLLMLWSYPNPYGAANILARPPTSRPPIAFGWPVIEKGAAPNLPILPVNK